MADVWFCEIAGREIGPLSAPQLRAMAARGQILPDDRVRQGTAGPWVAAAQVRGLFPTAPPPRAEKLPVARPAPSPPALPRAAAWAPESEQESFSEPSARSDDAPFTVNIITDSSTDTAARGARIARPRSKRRVQQQKMIFVLLVVAIIGLGVAALILVVGGGTGASKKVGHRGGLSGLADLATQKASESQLESPQNDEPALERPKDIEFAESPRVRPKITAELFDGQSEKSGGASAEQSAEESEWTDASAGPARAGDVAVKVVDAVLVRSSVDASEENSSTGGRLLIVLEIQNTGDRRKLDFLGWARRGVRLSDNFDNTYRPLPVGSAMSPGQGRPRSIYPGRAARETLVFEPPIRKAEYLRLELPASAFGQSGMTRLKIPATMIVEREEEARPPAAHEPDRRPPPREYPPGTPQGDFGIPDVDE